MAAALGVGNQMIAVLPEIDLVIVNRANTYDGQRTPMPELLDLIEAVLEARIGEPNPDPELAPLSVSGHRSSAENGAGWTVGGVCGRMALSSDASRYTAANHCAV